jgi:hypothetical protein
MFLNPMEINDLIKSELEYFQPMVDRELRYSSHDREIWRSETIRQRQERISLEVFDLCGGSVRYGPFKGLKLDRNPWWGRFDLGSQCLGLYELEILKKIEIECKKGSATFIDIGAADGYYAVGLLKSGMVDRAVCFEMSPEGRESIMRNWVNNGSPGDLQIYNQATEDSLLSLSEKDVESSLILIDIEGAEFDVMSHQVFKKLNKCALIVEIHNWVDDFSSRYSSLLRAASDTHQIKVIERVERSTVSIPELRDFTDDNRLLLVSERRPCMMRFLFFCPRDLESPCC